MLATARLTTGFTNWPNWGLYLLLQIHDNNLVKWCPPPLSLLIKIPKLEEIGLDSLTTVFSLKWNAFLIGSLWQCRIYVVKTKPTSGESKNLCHCCMPIWLRNSSENTGILHLKCEHVNYICTPIECKYVCESGHAPSDIHPACTCGGQMATLGFSSTAFWFETGSLSGAHSFG